MDVPARIINDRAMAPVRLLESAGLGIHWNGDERSVTVTNDWGHWVRFMIGESIARWHNGTQTPLDSPVVIVGNRTLLPIRAAFQAFGTVDWLPKTRLAVIWVEV